MWLMDKEQDLLASGFQALGSNSFATLICTHSCQYYYFYLKTFIICEKTLL